MGYTSEGAGYYVWYWRKKRIRRFIWRNRLWLFLLSLIAVFLLACFLTKAAAAADQQTLIDAVVGYEMEQEAWRGGDIIEDDDVYCKRWHHDDRDYYRRYRFWLEPREHWRRNPRWRPERPERPPLPRREHRHQRR